MKAESLFSQRAQNQMDGEFCEKYSAPFVDSECLRGAWLASRGAVAMRPVGQFYDILDSRRNDLHKFYRDAESVGVRFATKEEISIKVGHGHINIHCDGVIASGWPDASGQIIVKFRSVTKSEFKEIRDNGISEQQRNQGQLLMASGGIHKLLFVTYCPYIGLYNFALQDYNKELALLIWNTTNAGVESQDIPPQLPTVNGEVNPKCGKCSFASACMAPVIPSTTCRSCRHSQIGPNGSITCLPNNNHALNCENIMNLHKCSYHRYREGLISSWSTFDGQTGNNEFTYTNLLNGSTFVNGEGQGKYTSYEMSSVKGKNPAELIGDKAIDKLKNTFGASLI